MQSTLVWLSLIFTWLMVWKDPEKRSNTELGIEQLYGVIKTNMINNPRPLLCSVNKMQPDGMHILNIIHSFLRHKGTRLFNEFLDKLDMNVVKASISFWCLMRMREFKHYISLIVCNPSKIKIASISNRNSKKQLHLIALLALFSPE